MKYETTNATLSDAQQMAATMRPADRREFELLGGPDRTVEHMLMFSVELSDVARTVRADGELCTMYGVSTLEGLLSDEGNPWMVSTPVMLRHLRELLRQGPEVLDILHGYYPRLYNYVSADNYATMRWLRHVGFTFGPRLPFGPYQAPFYRFHRGFS